MAEGTERVARFGRSVPALVAVAQETRIRRVVHRAGTVEDFQVQGPCRAAVRAPPLDLTGVEDEF